MNFVIKNLRYFATASLSAAIGISATAVLAQDHKDMADKLKTKALKAEKTFCGGNQWSDGDRVSVSDLREMTVASSGTLNVDAGKNGGISVKGEDRGDVLVRACVQAWGVSDESARSIIGGIRINTGGEVRAEGPTSSDGNTHWSVSYQILVPRNTSTKLTAHNGGISISGVDGNAEFSTLNGGVNLSNVSGSVKGRTTNGGVNVTLAGNSWKGSGLDVQTTNGGVNLTLPATYAANIETGTVNGGYKSDIPSLNITQEDVKGDGHYRPRARRIATAINGGGAPIKIITTNGGVKINTLE